MDQGARHVGSRGIETQGLMQFGNGLLRFGPVANTKDPGARAQAQSRALPSQPAQIIPLPLHLALKRPYYSEQIESDKVPGDSSGGPTGRSWSA